MTRSGDRDGSSSVSSPSAASLSPGGASLRVKNENASSTSMMASSEIADACLPRRLEELGIRQHLVSYDVAVQHSVTHRNGWLAGWPCNTRRERGKKGAGIAAEELVRPPGVLDLRELDDVIGKTSRCQHLDGDMLEDVS